MATYSTSYVGGDFYAVLGLTNSALPAEIKKAYRRLNNLYHPDLAVNGITITDPQIVAALNTRFSEIEYAYTILNDHDRRKEYDLGGRDIVETQRQARITEAEEQQRQLETAEGKLTKIREKNDEATRLIDEAMSNDKQAKDNPIEKDALKRKSRELREEAEQKRESARRIDQGFAKATREEEATRRSAEGTGPTEDETGDGGTDGSESSRDGFGGFRGFGAGEDGDTDGSGFGGESTGGFRGSNARSGRRIYEDEYDEPAEDRGPGAGERFRAWAGEKARAGAQYGRATASRLKARFRTTVEGRIREQEAEYTQRAESLNDLQRERTESAARDNKDGGTHAGGGGEARG